MSKMPDTGDDEAHVETQQAKASILAQEELNPHPDRVDTGGRIHPTLPQSYDSPR